MNRIKYIRLIRYMILMFCYVNTTHAKEHATAYISDSFNSETTAKAHYYVLDRINGKKLESAGDLSKSLSRGKGFYMQHYSTGREVKIEEMTLSIKGYTNRSAPILSLLPGDFKIKGKIKFTPLANKKYIVNGTLSKEYSAVWLEEESGLIVSRVIQKGTLNKEESVKLEKIRAEGIKNYNDRQSINSEIHIKLKQVLKYYLEKNNCETAILESYLLSDIFKISKKLYESNKYKVSMSCFKLLTKPEQKNPKAMEYIGLMYELGQGVEANKGTAQFWYNMSLDNF